MTNKNDKLVVAYYQNIPTATGAAQQMMDWDEADDAIKLGAVAVLGYDPRTDELKTHEIGQRNTKKGALWGTAIGATLGILTGGIALIPGLIIGAGTGAVLGALDHKDVVLTDGEAADMLARVRSGAGALAVMADDFEVDAVRLFLARLGGEVVDFTLTDDMAEAVTAAAAAQASATTAVDGALDKSASMAQGGGLQLAVMNSLGAEEAAKLHEAGIDKASQLLAQAATPAGRAELAALTGISEEAILVVAKELDFMRIEGVHVNDAAALLAAGVETVPDLARRNAANLTAKLAEVITSGAVESDPPTQATVASWIAQATELPRMLTF